MENDILFFLLIPSFFFWMDFVKVFLELEIHVFPESNSASLNKWNEFHKFDMNSLTSVKVWKAAVFLFSVKWVVYNKTPITSGILN